jgi:hypothetical protein
MSTPDDSSFREIESVDGNALKLTSFSASQSAEQLTSHYFLRIPLLYACIAALQMIEL